MSSSDLETDRVARMGARSRSLLCCVAAGPAVMVVVAALILTDIASIDDPWYRLQVDLFLGLQFTVACGLPSLWTGLLIVRRDHSVLRWVAPLRGMLLAAIGVVVAAMIECSIRTDIWPAPYIPFPWESVELAMMCLAWIAVSVLLTWRWSASIRRSPVSNAHVADFLFGTELISFGKLVSPLVPRTIRLAGATVCTFVLMPWTKVAPSEADAFRAWWVLAATSVLGPVVGYGFGAWMTWWFRLDGWGMIAALVWSIIVTVIFSAVFQLLSITMGMWLGPRRRSVIKWVAPQTALVLSGLGFCNVWLTVAILSNTNQVTGVTSELLLWVLTPCSFLGAIVVAVLWTQWALRKADEFEERDRLISESNRSVSEQDV